MPESFEKGEVPQNEKIKTSLMHIIKKLIGTTL